MKKVIIFLLAILLSSSSFAQHGHARGHSSSRASHSRAKTVHVRSYTKKNGTHVRSYYRRPPHSK